MIFKDFLAQMLVARRVLLASALLGAVVTSPARGQDLLPCITPLSLQPLTLIRLVPHVRARANGKDVFLKFDTGFGGIGAVTQSAAARLGLKSVGRDNIARFSLSGDAREGSELVEVEELTLGEFSVNSVKVFLLSQNEMIEGEQNIDGVMGAEVLSFLDIIIDKKFGSTDILFFRNECKIYDFSPNTGEFRLNLLKRRGYYFVPIRADRTFGLGLIDTGSTMSSFFTECSADVMSNSKPSGSRTVTDFFGVKFEADTYEINKLYLDESFYFESPELLSVKRPPGLDEDVCFIVGMDILLAPMVQMVLISPSMSRMFVVINPR